MASEKRCLYEVLGLSRDCSPEEIRSAYKKLALQRHPDKLARAGIPEAEATAAFQELVNAYEVLSDQRERAWYDSHRNQILFAPTSTSGNKKSGSTAYVPDLFSYFSNSVYSGYAETRKGFYKVYGDLFEKIYGKELSYAKKLGLPLPTEAPLMGKLDSPDIQVTAFYNYWSAFSTSLDFFWEDEYDSLAGPDRKSRRVMEEENKKLRKKAIREYNETVRGLAKFVKKRDKRVINMQLKKNEEMERKKEEEKLRKQELERQKLERLRNYKEPEWAKINEEDDIDDDEDEEVVEQKNELYCVVCCKKFKSDKQWKNHEQSKKHKEKVAEYRETFDEEDREFRAKGGKVRKEHGMDDLSADDDVNDLQEKFESSADFKGEETEDEENEDSHVEAPATKTKVESDSDDLDFMNYNDTKVSRRNRGARKKQGRKQTEATEKIKTDISSTNGHTEEQDEENDDSHADNKTQADDSDDLEFMKYNDTKGSRRNKGGRRAKGKKHEEAAEKVKTDDASTNGHNDEEDKEDDDSHADKKAQPNNDSDDLDFMEYNDTRPSQRNKGGRKAKGRKHDEAAEKVKTNNIEATHGQDEEQDEQNDDSNVEESNSNILSESESSIKADDVKGKGRKHSRRAANKDRTKKKEPAVSSSKAPTKGRRQKGDAEANNACEKCGLEFESRTKLHKHLGDTGHASIKSR